MSQFKSQYYGTHTSYGSIVIQTIESLDISKLQPYDLLYCYNCLNSRNTCKYKVVTVAKYKLLMFSGISNNNLIPIGKIVLISNSFKQYFLQSGVNYREVENTNVNDCLLYKEILNEDFSKSKIFSMKWLFKNTNLVSCNILYNCIINHSEPDIIMLDDAVRKVVPKRIYLNNNGHLNNPVQELMMKLQFAMQFTDEYKRLMKYKSDEIWTTNDLYYKLVCQASMFGNCDMNVFKFI